MHQLSLAIETIKTETSHVEETEEKIIEDYKKLSEKCDTVINKIKGRKEKNQQKKS